MNVADNVREFKALEATIVASEADVEARKWRQAELAAEAVVDGMSRRDYAEAVGKHHTTIGRLVRVWARWGGAVQHQRPRFADAWATVLAGSGEVISQTEHGRRGRERLVPTRHDDRVEMVAKLLSDPDVARAAMPKVLAQPSQSQRLIEQEVRLRDGQERKRQRELAQRQAADSAAPLSAYMAKMATSVDQWARDLASMTGEFYDELEALPEGRNRELIAEALQRLAANAKRAADILEHKPDLWVIEGDAR